MLSRVFRWYLSTSSILIFALLGLLVGYLFASVGEFFKPVGDTFIRLIKMMLVPVIVVSITYSIASLHKTGTAVKVGGGVILYFFISSVLAGLVGFLFVYSFNPGVGLDQIPPDLLTLTPDFQKAIDSSEKLTPTLFLQNMIPLNPFFALSEGHLISVLFFSIFLGFALSSIEHKNKEQTIDILDTLSSAFMWMVGKIMILAPIAVFSLMAHVVSVLGVEIILTVLNLFVIIIAAGLVWVFLVLLPIITFTNKVSYKETLVKMLPLMFFAFSTSSSLVSLPKNIATCSSLNINKKVYSFVLPVAANLNMNGSSLFYVISAIFFVQMFNIDISFSTYILVILVAALGSMATPGIPGLSLAIIMVMEVAGAPLIGIPIILAVDRVLDMFVTTINVVGDTAAASVSNVIYNKNAK